MTAMQSVYDEIVDTLQAEVLVDVERLKSLCVHGIPDSLRGQVWNLMLTHETDKCTKLINLSSRSLSRTTKNRNVSFDIILYKSTHVT